MRFSEFLNALPATPEKFCHEITIRSNHDKPILLKKLLRGAFDAGRYNDPDRQRKPVPFMPDHSSAVDQLEVGQMEKWSGLWRARDYRAKESPAGPVLAALKAFSYKPNDTVIDFGCGRGVALQTFTDGGMQPTGLDIASNALDEHFAAHFPFIRACLWHLPDCLSSDYGFVCNVMEEIPIGKIDDVLLDIGIACKTQIFFHMNTKRPGGRDWEGWQDKLAKLGPQVDVWERCKDWCQFLVSFC